MLEVVFSANLISHTNSNCCGVHCCLLVGLDVTVGDRMFLGMQDFDFAQIYSLLLKFCLDFV